ncbi:hypothetical protein, partial [Pseudomonas aeruginosa]|uniref:hypothetical protein n=1 Tax=Pseudomonas aeruginosa TaxID=287 RepID=UPI001EE768D6
SSCNRPIHGNTHPFKNEGAGHPEISKKLKKDFPLKINDTIKTQRIILYLWNYKSMQPMPTST